MRRSASRLPRLIACAAVPAMLAVAGCSSGSDSKAKADAPTVQSSRAAAKVAASKYSELPEACTAISSRTIGELVPKAKVKGGTAGKSSDLDSRGSCSWNGLDDKGVKGSDYRWLDVSLQRYDSDETLGSGAKRAEQYYTQEVENAQGTDAAQDIKATPSSDIGDQSTTVTYSLKQTGVNFAYAIVVARTQNVVVTLTYNGAGYAGAKSPSSAALLGDAVRAANETVASVDGSDGQTGAGTTTASTPPSKTPGPTKTTKAE